MDKAVKKLHIVTLDREKSAKKILERETNWDRKFPIPITWFGGASMKEFAGIDLIHTSGDDHCIWVGNAVSALVLYMKGHSIIEDKAVLAKRKTFKTFN